MNLPLTIFENSNELDIRALKTFGVSVKENENPIGFFGTGLKYAIAILLREGQSITVFSGKVEYTFQTKEENIRGKPFSLITMNGEELGFTTLLGQTWELWMAYRELWCNTIDEGGSIYKAQEMPFPEERKTFISIEGKKFQEIHQNRSAFFLQSSSLECFDKITVHPNSTSKAYFQGICIGDAPFPGNTRYTYNTLKNISLTEDRLLKYGFQYKRYIGEAILTSKSEEYIMDCLICGDSYIEGIIDLTDCDASPSELFIKVAQKILLDASLYINPSVRSLIIAHNIQLHTPALHRPTPVEEKMLQKSIIFCKKLNFPVDEYPIKIVTTLGQGILGQAKNETIFLSIEAFSMGTKMVAGTLIEEYIHLLHGYGDETRSMQNFLLNKIISLGEELQQEPL